MNRHLIYCAIFNHRLASEMSKKSAVSRLTSLNAAKVDGDKFCEKRKGKTRLFLEA
jgi:hypothetical protein